MQTRKVLVDKTRSSTGPAAAGAASSVRPAANAARAAVRPEGVGMAVSAVGAAGKAVMAATSVAPPNTYRGRRKTL